MKRFSASLLASAALRYCAVLTMALACTAIRVAQVAAKEPLAGASKTSSVATSAAKSPVRRRWRVSFELAFGDGSPYARRFPNLYNMSYARNEAITRDVLDRIVPLVLHDVGVRRVAHHYGPGGYLGYAVVPSAQLDIEATSTDLMTVMDSIGYLAQQTEVIAARPDPSGDTPALQVVETRGNRLDRTDTVQSLWRSLRKAAPFLQGFQPARVDDRPGLRMIDTTRSWKVRDIVNFDAASNRVATAHRLPLRTFRFMTRLAKVSNDWRRFPDGREYLVRLEGRGRAPLKRRLTSDYRQLADRWIRQAFQPRRVPKTPGS